jgi:septal ring factor EnvC (AmiA/AmiB activator)
MTLRRRLSARTNEAVAWRVAEQVDPLRADLHESLGRLEHRLAEMERRLDTVARESAWAANELARLNPQVSAFETRLEQQARPEVITGDLQDLPEARSLVEIVREEHARVRARLALVSAYEERLRRLEARMLAEQPTG